MKQSLKRLYLRLIAYDAELARLVADVERRCQEPGARVLDLGCGHGRLLALLARRGFAVTGVDENEAIVASNRAAGLPCQSAEEFARGDTTFDVIVMSHLIEHFAPAALVEFLDRHLDRLRAGGALIIATPLQSPYFYDDLDHVRPYPPASIQMAFSPGVPQTRHRPRNRMLLRDVWFRRAHFRPVSFKGMRMRTWTTLPLAALECASALAFHASFQLFGRTDGWVGVFEKS
ncbi:MAG TPA: methyltransferase domain-containing protein [Burkholderiales bacterium]|nr:methyltransferase domain-containing protein [Burkholderiales bacterium]